MDIRAELLAEHSKAQTVKIANYIGKDQKLFDELFELFINDNWRINQRGVWAILHCALNHPPLIQPHFETLLKNLQKPATHDAVKRNSIKILTEIEIPERLKGLALDICFEFLISMQESIAVKVFSMQVVFDISKNEPDLLRELATVIEDQFAH